MLVKRANYDPNRFRDCGDFEFRFNEWLQEQGISVESIININNLGGNHYEVWYRG